MKSFTSLVVLAILYGLCVAVQSYPAQEESWESGQVSSSSYSEDSSSLNESTERALADGRIQRRSDLLITFETLSSPLHIIWNIVYSILRIPLIFASPLKTIFLTLLHVVELILKEIENWYVGSLHTRLERSVADDIVKRVMNVLYSLIETLRDFAEDGISIPQKLIASINDLATEFTRNITTFVGNRVTGTLESLFSILFPVMWMLMRDVILPVMESVLLQLAGTGLLPADVVSIIKSLEMTYRLLKTISNMH